MKPIIVIPIYKENLSDEEKASLKQCAKILGKYIISFICEPNLDCTEYKNILSDFDVTYNFVYFSKEYFKGVIEYSRLMMEKDFYEKFKNYSHMLIYQLDAWVFKDELEYWCSQPFDYIGAPWFEAYHLATDNNKLLPKAGNGGFSLRNIQKMIDTIDIYENEIKYKVLKLASLIYKKEGLWCFLTHFLKTYKDYSRLTTRMYEDRIISEFFEWFNPDFVVADSAAAIRFSFELNPQILYEMNNNNLPFGCHAFKKYNWDFWKNYIEI